MTHPGPIVTPARMMERAPSQQPSPTTIGAPSSGPARRVNNAATATIQVGAPFIPPTTAPAVTSTKAATASLTGTAIVGRVLTARIAGHATVTGYQWQIRQHRRWRNLAHATRRNLVIKPTYIGLRLRARITLTSGTIYSQETVAVRRR